jgi:hypothetical protein
VNAIYWIPDEKMTPGRDGAVRRLTQRVHRRDHHLVRDVAVDDEEDLAAFSGRHSVERRRLAVAHAGRLAVAVAAAAALPRQRRFDDLARASVSFL